MNIIVINKSWKLEVIMAAGKEKSQSMIKLQSVILLLWRLPVFLGVDNTPHKACQDLSNWMTLKYTPTENCSDNFFSVQFIPEYSTKFHAKILKVNETSQENDIYFTEEPVFTTISPWPMFCVPNKYMKNDTYYIGSWFIRKHNSQCQPIQKYYSIDSLRVLKEVETLFFDENNACFPTLEEDTEILLPTGYRSQAYCHCSIEDTYTFNKCLNNSNCRAIYSGDANGKTVCLTKYPIWIKRKTIIFQKVTKCKTANCYAIQLLKANKIVIIPGHHVESLHYDYSGFYFSNTSITIQWNEATQCNNQEDYVLVQVLDGAILNTINQGNSLQAVINKNETQLSFLSLYGYYVKVMLNGVMCQASDTLLKFPDDLLTLNEGYNPATGFCVQPSGYHFVVIFPKGDHPDNGSCICPQWRQISLCSCNQDQNYFSVFNRQANAGIKICWMNITNNTKIHFAIEQLFPNNDGIPFFHLQFVISYNAIIGEVPSAPRISLLQNNLCFFNTYDGHLQVNGYELEVTDVTEFQYNYVLNNTGAHFCKNINTLPFLPICGPFIIDARSHNDIGYSEYASYETGVASGDECRCFNDNFNLLLNYNYAMRKINCKFETSYSNIQSIPLKFRLSTNNVVIKIVAENCPGVIDFKFDYRDGSYSVNTVYKTCAVNSSINFSIETLKNDDNQDKDLIIGATTGTAIPLVLLILLIIAIIAFRYAKNRQQKRNSMQVQKKCND